MLVAVPALVFVASAIGFTLYASGRPGRVSLRRSVPLIGLSSLFGAALAWAAVRLVMWVVTDEPSDADVGSPGGGRPLQFILPLLIPLAWIYVTVKAIDFARAFPPNHSIRWPWVVKRLRDRWPEFRPTQEQTYRRELRGLDPALLESVVEECAADPDRKLPDWRELKRRTEERSG